MTSRWQGAPQFRNIRPGAGFKTGDSVKETLGGRGYRRTTPKFFFFFNEVQSLNSEVKTGAPPPAAAFCRVVTFFSVIELHFPPQGFERKEMWDIMCKHYKTRGAVTDTGHPFAGPSHTNNRQISTLVALTEVLVLIPLARDRTEREARIDVVQSPAPQLFFDEIAGLERPASGRIP